MKGPEGSLVDRLDQLVQNGRSWATSELNLLKAKAEYAAKAYIIAAAALLTASIVCGTAIVLLAVSAVVALTPSLGLAGAYAAMGFFCLVLVVALGAYAYWSIRSVHPDLKSIKARKH